MPTWRETPLTKRELRARARFERSARVAPRCRSRGRRVAVALARAIALAVMLTLFHAGVAVL